MNSGVLYAQGNVAIDTQGALQNTKAIAAGKNTNIAAQSIDSTGIFDNAEGRAYVQDHLTEVLNDPFNIMKVQKNGRIVKESLLAGPEGVVKVQAVWDGDKLITIQIFGGP